MAPGRGCFYGWGMYIASKADGGEREGQGVVPIDLLDYYLSLSLFQTLKIREARTELKENFRLLESQRG